MTDASTPGSPPPYQATQPTNTNAPRWTTPEGAEADVANNDPAAMHWLACHLLENNTDHARALTLLREAAALNYQISVFTLGLVLNGLSRYKLPTPMINYAEGRKWLETPTVAHRGRQFFHLASIYEKGLGVQADQAKAREYYCAGADAGDIQSKIWAGYWLMHGLGGGRLEAKASGYLEGALRLLETPRPEDVWMKRRTELRLAQLLLKASSIPRDTSRALKLLDSVAATGEKEAAEELQKYRAAFPEPDGTIAEAIAMTEAKAAYHHMVNLVEFYLQHGKPWPGQLPHAVLRGTDVARLQHFAQAVTVKLAEMGALCNHELYKLDLFSWLNHTNRGWEDLSGRAILIYDTRPTEMRTLPVALNGEVALAKHLAQLAQRNSQPSLLMFCAKPDEAAPAFLSRYAELGRRLDLTIDFPNYSEVDLFNLFKLYAKKYGFTLADDAEEKLTQAISDRLKRDVRLLDHNAFLVEELFKECISLKAIAKAPEKVITAADIPTAKIITPPPLAELLGPVERLVGLHTTKNEVRALTQLLLMQQKRSAAGLPNIEVCLHSIFTGPPGTGKTTLARLMGRILAQIGYLAKGHVVEVTRGDLVARYIGQTAPLVKEVVDRADGGILLIDEAYMLTPANNDQDLGSEAVATLLKLMEDRRGRFMVIATGYEKEMIHFLDSNPGLRSRFARVVNFPAYGVEELMQILHNMAADLAYHLADGANKKVRSYLLGLSEAQRNTFGNARGVRSLLERAITAHAGRVLANGEEGKALELIVSEDISFLHTETEESSSQRMQVPATPSSVIH